MLRQEESLSLSLNSTWGVRRRFEQGKVTINEKKFLGYDKDSEGNLIINERQAVIVRRIYKDFLDGKGTAHITRELEEEKVKNWNGTSKWYESTIKSILRNEKYKGDAILQKTYTVDFLTKERVKNTGKVPKYYVEESHPAIIELETWEAVQLEMERRKKFCEEHNIKKLDTRLPFWGKVICGVCGTVYCRKTWMNDGGKNKRKVWICSNRYRTKGVKGCDSKHVDEEVLKKAFMEVVNVLVENKQHFLDKWRAELEDSNALKQYRFKMFIRILEPTSMTGEFDESLCLKILDQIKVIDGKGKMYITLLDGTSMQCKNNN
ncbi:recombinase family protein [Cellulosilyticum sp. ST5]|uniref:recombinase family protein n=1 Tax=Cellulosilyticum sp. ST5 TaxID=3055805 RepID=UPI00397742AF